LFLLRKIGKTNKIIHHVIMENIGNLENVNSENLSIFYGFVETSPRKVTDKTDGLHVGIRQILKIKSVLEAMSDVPQKL